MCWATCSAPVVGTHWLSWNTSFYLLHGLLCKSGYTTFWSGRYGLNRFGLSHFVLSHFDLAVSVVGHFDRDISVHKELMKFVKHVNVTEYPGRIIIYPYNTRQIKTRQFALPKARSNSGAKMIKFSATEILSKIPSEIKSITCLALFAANYKKYVLLGYQKRTLCSYWCTWNRSIDLIILSLLQWKLSNHEVSPLYFISFGFRCVHQN